MICSDTCHVLPLVLLVLSDHPVDVVVPEPALHHRLRLAGPDKGK